MQIIRSLLVVSLLGASTAIYAKRLPLEKLNLPEGFVIEKYADVPNARQMNHGGDGVVYVGTRKDGDVYAVVDNNGDGKSDAVHLIDDNLNMPSGLAYKDGDLYVGAVSEILVYRNIDSQLQNPPKPEVLTDQLPDKRHHGWNILDLVPTANSISLSARLAIFVCQTTPNSPRFFVWISITQHNWRVSPQVFEILWASIGIQPLESFGSRTTGET